MKASTPGNINRSMSGGPGTRDPGQITFSNFNLSGLFYTAYKPMLYEVTLPPWMDEVSFDIAAKVPAGATREDVWIMLRSLLAERFQIQLHRVPKTMTGYALRLPAGAPKLQPSPPPPDGEDPNLTPASQIGLTRDKDGFMVFPAGYANMITLRGSDGLSRLTAGRQTMEVLATYLAGRLQQPVIDETGLKGIYDFHLSFATGSGDTPHEDGPEADHSQPSDPAPTLLQAIEQQLGLKMEARKLPVEIIVIDHIERTPIEN